jgi:hypothetical protein
VRKAGPFAAIRERRLAAAGPPAGSFGGGGADGGGGPGGGGEGEEAGSGPGLHVPEGFLDTEDDLPARPYFPQPVQAEIDGLLEDYRVLRSYERLQEEKGWKADRADMVFASFLAERRWRLIGNLSPELKAWADPIHLLWREDEALRRAFRGAEGVPAAAGRAAEDGTDGAPAADPDRGRTGFMALMRRVGSFFSGLGREGHGEEEGKLFAQVPASARRFTEPVEEEASGHPFGIADAPPSGPQGTPGPSTLGPVQGMDVIGGKTPADGKAPGDAPGGGKGHDDGDRRGRMRQ